MTGGNGVALLSCFIIGCKNVVAVRIIQSNCYDEDKYYEWRLRD